MHSTELIIIGLYLLVLVPAVVVPLIWAAIVDGRYHSAYVQRHAQNSLRRVARAPASRLPTADIHLVRRTA